MPHVFISYKRENASFAYEVQSSLMMYGFPVWMDNKISAGSRWQDSIEKALRESIALIVVITPEACRSHFVTYEWSFALGRDIPIIPVLDGGILPDEIHPCLSKIQYHQGAAGLVDVLLPNLSLVPSLDSVMVLTGIIRTASTAKGGHRDYRYLDKVAVALGDMGTVAQPELLRMLHEQNYFSREWATKAFGQMKGEEGLEGLREALKTDQWQQAQNFLTNRGEK